MNEHLPKPGGRGPEVTLPSVTVQTLPLLLVGWGGDS